MEDLEYWFLDSAVELPVGFSWVIPDEEYGMLAINRQPLNVSTTEIANVLHHLFQNGDLLASVHVEAEGDLIGGFVLSLDEIKDVLEGTLPAKYYMTSQGAERWERFSYPNWNLYFNGWVNFDPDEGEMICANRQLLEAYFSLEHFISDLCHIPGSEKWNIVEPWQATYWKTLPIGHRVYYRHKPNQRLEISDDTPVELIKEEEKATNWYSSIKKWYTNYFKE